MKSPPLTMLIKAASAVILFSSSLFFNFYLPQTPGRMALPTADLIGRLSIWRWIAALPLTVISSSYGVALLLTGFVLAAFFAYTVAIILQWNRMATGRGIVFVFVTSVILFSLSVLALPNFNNDIYNYILRGRLAAKYNVNPYVVAADQFEHDPVHPYANPQYTHDPGGKLPLWMHFNRILASLTDNSVPFMLLLYRFALLIFNLANAVLIGLVLKKINPRYLLAGLIFYAWNPVVFTSGQSKTDTFAIFFLLLGVYLHVREKPGIAFVLIGLSVLVKIVTLPLLLIYLGAQIRAGSLRRMVPPLVILAAVTAILYWPYWHGTATAFMHMNYALKPAESSGMMLLRQILKVVFVAVVLTLAWWQNGMTGRLLLGWTLAFLYLAVLLINFAFSWYLINLVAIAGLMGKYRYVLITTVICMFSFFYNCWYMTYSSDFHVREIYTIPNILIYILLPITALVTGLALVSWQRRKQLAGD